MVKRTILVVEDEQKITEVLQLYLERDGYRTKLVADGGAALGSFKREEPDLVILDLNLPGLDGLEVCRRIRQESAVPIIMLTARGEEVDKLLGLELGADDYITKPFSPREVVARVRAVLRRATAAQTVPDILKAGELTVDPSRHEALCGDQRVDLTPTEFQILEVLLRDRGRVFTRLQLLDLVQGEAFEGYERVIDAHVRNLRQKIEPDPRRPRYVQTVFGVGYKFRSESGG